VVFDAATIADTATFERPKERARGVECVLVNGKVAYRGGEATGRSGRFLPRAPRETEARA
jgi:N-acyl-D-amino-acid deacylase